MQDPSVNEPSIKALALSALRWSAAAQFVIRLMNWAITIVVVRLLTPQDFGLIAMAAVLVNFASLFAGMGLHVVIVQKSSLTHQDISKLFGAVLISNVAAFSFVQLSAPLFGLFYGQEVEPIIRFLSLTFLITAFSTVPHALLARKLDFRSIFLVSLSSSICSDLTRLIMALMGFGVWSLVSSQIVSSFVGTIGALWVTRFWMAPNFKLKSIIEELRFGLQIVAKGILAYFNRQIDVIIIGKFLGSIALGSYSVAVRLSRFPARFALRPISGVSLSAFARIGGQPDKVRKYFLQMVEHLLLIFFPVCWAVSAFAEEMVLTVFGVKWALAIPVLQIVVLIAPIRALYRLLLPILDALGRPKVGLLNQTTTVLCLIPSIFLGVRWGLIGVSVAWVCAHLCAAIINLRRSLPFLNVLPRDLITVLWRTVFASTMMYMSIIGGKFLLPNEASVQLRLIELIGIGTIVYGGLILSINRAVIIRMVRLILNSDRDSSA